MQVLLSFEYIFLYDKCMKTYIVFRVLLKMYKIDFGQFFSSVTIF